MLKIILRVHQLGRCTMSKLLNVALAVALGFAISRSLYAADTPQRSQTYRSTAMSDAEVRAALDKCDSLTETPQARCIVNIRPTVAMTPGSSAEGMVKDGTPITEAEYAAAVKECESADAANRERCVNAAKEHFGRM
jgi:hypothetical protein